MAQANLSFVNEATPPRTRDQSPFAGTKSDASPELAHTKQILSSWRELKELRQGKSCVVDGRSLVVADVVAVAKYGARCEISSDPEIERQIQRSVQTLHRHLQGGHLVYGVTTGFGGSADTRTTKLDALQRALLQHQHIGILTSKDINSSNVQSSASDFDSQFDTQSMPTSWVRASMLTRCNSIIRGHSAVRLAVAERILTLVQHEITPIVPLRGSISASGDLSPLSYIAGTVEGNPDIFVRCGRGTKKILSAPRALEELGLAPIPLEAKEGLGLINGTAFSAATASLAMSQAQEMAILSQVLTGMCVEALQGTAESFYPRIAEMRPHPGQIESASNILSFLAHSKLAHCVEAPKDTKMTGLYQDRYASRTASQWIAPQIEDLFHAQNQLQTELNSTTDNPLLDTESDHILHGGNFQAAVVTSTMDRTRLALEKFGRMMFAQATEIINPTLNGGLPANLASDDPSLSFTCKGLDISMAAYASELALLANPVGNHVMSAEMHNQAINSLALISSRYTFEMLNVMHMMSAAYLFIVCQALDLRAVQLEFEEKVQPMVRTCLDNGFTDASSDRREELFHAVWSRFLAVWPTTTTKDLYDRCHETCEAVTIDLVKHFAQHQASSSDFASILAFVSELKTILQQNYETTRSSMYERHLDITPAYLGNGARRMYTFIRKDLQIPFHRGLAEHPTEPAPSDMSEKSASQRRNIGSSVSRIYEALRGGKVSDVLMEIVTESFVQRGISLT